MLYKILNWGGLILLCAGIALIFIGVFSDSLQKKKRDTKVTIIGFCCLIGGIALILSPF